MNLNPKLSYAIAAILGACAAGYANAAAPAADADETVDTGGIQEIQVTAQRRTESIQNVPITIQAVTGDQLKQLNVQTFDDLIKYTPNVTFSGNGPGGGNIFMRGLSSGGNPNQSTGTTSPFPNVGLYLDDQSMQFPGRNNDVYMVDMERVEVLEGPQGTLFGGGAQAGAVRYITNKPKLDVTEGYATAGYGITASGGDPNTNGNLTLNIPLIADTLAVRGVVFVDHRGGYIDNVLTTTQYGNSPVVSNATQVQTNQNPVTYEGFRLSALWKINDDWNVLVQQNYQDLKADGYFAEFPNDPNGVPLKPYETATFSPAYDKDKYQSTTWTLNGNIAGIVKAVYTGSFMTRHIEQQSDYSNYLRSASGSAYTCTGAGSNSAYFKSAKPTTCYAPVGSWHDATENTHESHELRFSTPDDWRLRALVGAYYEKFDIRDLMNFNYLAIPQCDAANLAISAGGGPDCVTAVGPYPGSVSNDPSLRTDTNTAFGEDIHRGYTQYAFFTSVDFDLIPKVLTVTAGTRLFHYSEYEVGSEFYTGTSGSLNVANGACTAAGGCGEPINLHKKESGSRSRANITWHITPDILAYYTFSQGFRPGGFNRTNSINGVISLSGVAPYAAPPGNGPTKQFNKPVGYNSDNLINNEVGLKSEFFDHRIQVNASAYLMHWNGIQLPLFDPLHLGNTQFDVNGPSFDIRGAELQVVARATEGLTIQGSTSYNHSKQTSAPCLISNRPTAGNPTPLGTCITQIGGAPYTNPYGVLGTSPAFAPELEFNIRARYDIAFGDYKTFVSVGANHIGSQRNEPESFPDGNGAFCSPTPSTTLCKYEMPAYTTYDASIGVAKDSWTAQITGNNLSNSDASTFTSSGQFIKSEVPLRPRVLTLQLGYKF
jgi:iron complex outermembrane receptor protein